MFLRGKQLPDIVRLKSLLSSYINIKVVLSQTKLILKRRLIINLYVYSSLRVYYFIQILSHVLKDCIYSVLYVGYILIYNYCDLINDTHILRGGWIYTVYNDKVLEKLEIDTDGSKVTYVQFFPVHNIWVKEAFD